MNSRTGMIIPVYNREITWQRAAESVLRQSLPVARLILIDDGSTDNTHQNIKEWIARNMDATEYIESTEASKAKDTEEAKGIRDHGNNNQAGAQTGKAAEPEKLRITETETSKKTQIELVSQKNLGASHARNHGLEVLRSYEDCDFVCFLDSDDEIADDFISRTSQLLSHNQEAIAASVPRLSIYDEDIIFDDMHDFGRAPMQWTLCYGASILSSSLFRLSALPEKAFLESQQIGEDMLLVAQLQKIQNQEQVQQKTELNNFWLISSGQASKFWRVSTSNEEQSMTLKSNPHKTLSVTLDSIKIRKMAVTICALRSSDYPYYHSTLGDWYLLAYKLAHKMSRFFISKYLVIASYHKTFALIIWIRQFMTSILRRIVR